MEQGCPNLQEFHGTLLLARRAVLRFICDSISSRDFSRVLSSYSFCHLYSKILLFVFSCVNSTRNWQRAKYGNQGICRGKISLESLSYLCVIPHIMRVTAFLTLPGFFRLTMLLMALASSGSRLEEEACLVFRILCQSPATCAP